MCLVYGNVWCKQMPIIMCGKCNRCKIISIPSDCTVCAQKKLSTWLCNSQEFSTSLIPTSWGGEESGGVIPCINLCDRWKQVVCFTPWPCLPLEACSLRADLNAVGMTEAVVNADMEVRTHRTVQCHIVYASARSNLKTRICHTGVKAPLYTANWILIQHPACSIVTILTKTSWFHLQVMKCSCYLHISTPTNPLLLMAYLGNVNL